MEINQCSQIEFLSKQNQLWNNQDVTFGDHPKANISNQSFIDQYLIQDSTVTQTDTNSVHANDFFIPSGYTCNKIYKRPYKDNNEFTMQCNKFLLHCYNNGHDPCYKKYNSNITLKHLTNTEIYKSDNIFGFKITKEPIFIKRIHEFYINFCALLAEYNPYKDKTKGIFQEKIKCIRFDLHYPITFNTISPVSHKQRKKYKRFYTEKFTTKYISYFNKLLVHYLKQNFSRYMIMYNAEYRDEHNQKFTAKNPHHHFYVYFNSSYSLKKFFDALNTYWCLSLKISLSDNKRSGLVHQCPPHKKKENNTHWEYTNGNGLILNMSNAKMFEPNLRSIFMRSSYICKRVRDNKQVDLGKQFNIMTDDTTKQYLQNYPQYILPPYYKP